MWAFFVVLKLFYILMFVMATQIICVKTHRTVQVNFSSFKLQHSKQQTEGGQKDQQYLVLARTGSNGNCHTLLLGIYSRTATSESNLTVPYKIKHIFPMGPCDCTLVYLPQRNENVSTQCSKHFYLL